MFFIITKNSVKSLKHENSKKNWFSQPLTLNIFFAQSDQSYIVRMLISHQFLHEFLKSAMRALLMLRAPGLIVNWTKFFEDLKNIFELRNKIAMLLHQIVEQSVYYAHSKHKHNYRIPQCIVKLFQFLSVLLVEASFPASRRVISDSN